MGESNPYATNLISDLTGHAPVYGKTEDGQQCLTIGKAVIVANGYGLWGDPAAYQHDSQTLTVSWGGQSVTLVQGDDGSWAA